MTESKTESTALSNLSTESRSFPPSEEFAAQANAKADLYDHADADREAFWGNTASTIPSPRSIIWKCYPS